MVSLLVTVAVEPDTPGGEVQARTSLRNLEGAARFQRLAERFNVRPTWLLPYPALSDPRTDWFGELWSTERAEIGAHLLPWITPPFEANEDRLIARPPSAIPASAVEGKLRALTDAIERTLGRRPRAHRAAGHGLNGAALQALERLDYGVDSSVTPFIGAEGGAPDWRAAPEAPYFPDRQQPHLRGSSPVLEVPLTVGWDRPLPGVVARALTRCGPALERVVQTPWVPIPRLRWLDPCRSDAGALRTLAETAIERGLPCLTLNLRSPALWPGESAECPDAAQVDKVFERVDGFLRFAIDELRATPRTLSGFAAHYLNETGCV